MAKHSIIGSYVVIVLLIAAPLAVGGEVQFKVVGAEPPAERYRVCRQMLVGPWHNQPEEYEGYNGFVGWAGVTRRRSGGWLITFTSGHWHATYPWTDVIRKDPEALALFNNWQKVGLPDIDAPRGGRAHIMFSDDEGASWSRPQTLIDTKDDDRHPTVLELDDGTLLSTWRVARFPSVGSCQYMLSHDGGETWADAIELDETREIALSNGAAMQLADGTVLYVTYGPFEGTDHTSVGIYRSTDRARSFQLHSIIEADYHLEEPTVAELPDGRLVMVMRREGNVSWSDDGGKTWTQSNATGWDLFDPHLIVAPNGVLALFHGSYKTGKLRVLLSPDGGQTWHGPAEWLGYSVDPSVYGYCHPIVLPDGTIYLVYLNTGGHLPADARTEALWGLRVRVHDDAGGIDILPAPGSPAAVGPKAGGLEQLPTQGGDPELGNLP